MADKKTEPIIDPVEAAVKHRHDEMMKEYVALQAAHMKEASESDEVLEKYLDHERRHAEARKVLPKAKPIYIYGPNECRPVHPSLGSKCSTCGWVFGGKTAKDLSPHAVG